MGGSLKLVPSEEAFGLIESGKAQSIPRQVWRATQVGITEAEAVRLHKEGKLAERITVARGSKKTPPQAS
jgi:hypothetical protein